MTVPPTLRPVCAPLLLAALFFAGCRTPFDPVVIRFQGVDIRRSAFLKELEPLGKDGTDTTDPTMRSSAFSRFVEERVVALAATRQGFKDAGENRTSAERWLTLALATTAVTEAEAQAFYEAHPDVATVAESVTVREILLTTLHDARDVVRILASDRNAFELLARARSKSPQASSGGLLGSFQRRELPPEIDQAVFALAPGQVSGIVTTTFGFHVLRLESKTPASMRSFADSRPEIKVRLAESKARLKMKQLIDALVSQAQVNYEAVMAR